MNTLPSKISPSGVPLRGSVFAARWEATRSAVATACAAAAAALSSSRARICSWAQVLRVIARQ